VKLTIGPVFASSNGTAEKCRANRLLTRAVSADQPGGMMVLSLGQARDATQDIFASGADIELPLNHLPVG
jgi:hypothetical protein